jgi:hypothetical protein
MEKEIFRGFALNFEFMEYFNNWKTFLDTSMYYGN